MKVQVKNLSDRFPIRFTNKIVVAPLETKVIDPYIFFSKSLNDKQKKLMEIQYLLPKSEEVVEEVVVPEVVVPEVVEEVVVPEVVEEVVVPEVVEEVVEEVVVPEVVVPEVVEASEEVVVHDLAHFLNMKLSELKELCAQNNLDTKGSKFDLANRLFNK